MKTRLTALVCFAVFMTCHVRADVRLPEIFDNNMVLQRDTPIPIWGWADPQETISVTFGTQTVNSTANADGKWSLKLTPLKANAEPSTLTVKGKNEINLTNILVGDVWLCSGQSNMQWSMAQSDRIEYVEILKTVNNPNLRLFHVAQKFNADPQDKLPIRATWVACSADAVPDFSAVALHFGRKLQAELGVPIGLINSSWGGTRIEPWIPPVGFQSVPSLKSFADELETRTLQSEAYKKLVNKTLQEYQSWIDESKKASGRITAPPKLPEILIPTNNTHPTVLYNTMIYPLVPFALKGVIWYQGESNMGDGMLYAEKMKALIQGWRKVFDNADLGFYYVQLAPYIYGNHPPTALPEFWEAQSSVEKALPKTGQAVINDLVDNIRDIHPVRKKPVGERLALLALNRTYGKSEVACSSPEFDRMDVNDSTLTVYFRNAKALQVLAGMGMSGVSFEIAGADGVYHGIDRLDVSGAKIGLTSPRVAKPVSVRFSWRHDSQSVIHNEFGLPLGAFRASME